MNTKRAIIAIIVAVATMIGVAIAGSSAGATSYYEDHEQCYTYDCEETTTTEYVEETTTTEVTTTTSTVPETTTTVPEIEPEIGTSLTIERELPPYVAPIPAQPAGPKPISFTG